jgi:hypothetical protein
VFPSGRPIKRPGELTCVDVHHEESLLYWTGKFNISPVKLRQIVRLVGSRFKDVALFLETGRLPGSNLENDRFSENRSSRAV